MIRKNDLKLCCPEMIAGGGCEPPWSLLLPAPFPWICPSMRGARRRLGEREKRQRSRALLHLTGFHLIKLRKELGLNGVF